MWWWWWWGIRWWWWIIDDEGAFWVIKRRPVSRFCHGTSDVEILRYFPSLIGASVEGLQHLKTWMPSRLSMALLKIHNLISVTLQLFKTRCRKLAQAWEPLVSQMAVWGEAVPLVQISVPGCLLCWTLAWLRFWQREPLQTLSLKPSFKIGRGHCSVSAVNYLWKKSLLKVTPNSTLTIWQWSVMCKPWYSLNIALNFTLESWNPELVTVFRKCSCGHFRYCIEDRHGRSQHAQMYRWVTD